MTTNSVDVDAILASHDHADSLAPSRRFILRVVCGEGPLTRDDIAAATGYSVKTVDRACDDLVSAGLLRRDRDPNDLRKVEYHCTDDADR